MTSVASGLHRWRFLAVVLVPGAVLMALEIVSSRLLAPSFGNSVYVWGSIIGVFLAAMSAGYVWGGRRADLTPELPALGWLLAASAACQWLTSMAGRGVVEWLGAWSGGRPAGTLVATALLFATDGYAMIVRGFTTSYRALPLSGVFSFETLARLLTDGIGQMFLAAVQIAGPLVAVLFCTDVALGLLTRVAPGLNVFSLAFPVKILLTIGVAGTAIVLLPQAFNGLIDRAVHAMLTLVGG